jgi:uncharacterized protein DUF4224
MIVPKADLVTLTGYIRASAQIRWLRRHGWRYEVNGLGQPIVAQAEFNRHLVGGRSSQQLQDVNLEGINDSNAGKPAKDKR